MMSREALLRGASCILCFAAERRARRIHGTLSRRPIVASTEDKFYRARVLERIDVSDDLWKLRVEPGGPFGFVAGQYATLGVQTPEKLVERAYSIVSSPYEDTLELFFELVPQGDLTPLLFKLNPGDELTMRKIAKGRFTLDLKSGHTKHLLLCTVTGIAPFIS